MMGKKFRFPRGTKKRLLLEQKANGATVSEAIRNLKEKDIHIAASYAWDVYNQEPKPEKEQPRQETPQQPQEQPKTELGLTNLETEEKPIPIPTLEESKPLSPELDAIKKSIDQGTFTKEDLTALFKIINDYFDTFGYGKYKPSEQSAALLATAWLKPINKKLEKITEKDENFGIYAAIGLTMVVYVPRLGMIVSDKMKQKKAKKDESLKKLTEGEQKTNA